MALVAEQVGGCATLIQNTLQQWLEEAAFMPLAGRNEHFQRQPAAVGYEMDLRAPASV